LSRAAGEQQLAILVEREFERHRARLVQFLGMESDPPGIVLTPSGTDAQLMAMYTARACGSGEVSNIVVAADETGSGSMLSVSGRHFSSQTSRGIAVPKGDVLEGLSDLDAPVPIYCRAENGDVRRVQELDAAISASIQAHRAKGRRVLLFAMRHSKLGSSCPSDALLERICCSSEGAVQVIVDACQGRISPLKMRRYLEWGCILLFTGSKFFTGPSFSGAVLVPSSLSQIMRTARWVPAGLRDYTSKCDWPADWQGIRDALPTSPNIGQFLRWVAALHEMRAYFDVPLEVRKSALGVLAEGTSRLLLEYEDIVHPVHSVREPNDWENLEMTTQTVFPFLVRAGRREGFVSANATAAIYKLLRKDISSRLPPGTSKQERAHASDIHELGQPVQIGRQSNAIAALRISIGARSVYESRAERDGREAPMNLAAQLEKVRGILAKVTVMLKYGLVPLT
jgi:hypothetical protein